MEPFCSCLRTMDLRCGRVVVDVKFLNVPHTCRNNGTDKLSTGLMLLGTFSLYPLEGLIFPCSPQDTWVVRELPRVDNLTQRDQALVLKLWIDGKWLSETCALSRKSLVCLGFPGQCKISSGLSASHGFETT